MADETDIQKIKDINDALSGFSLQKLEVIAVFGEIEIVCDVKPQLEQSFGIELTEHSLQPLNFTMTSGCLAKCMI